MKIYNTLTKEREEFVPAEVGTVKMYVCGPTVNKNIHIGNARPMVFFDAARRYLEYKGYAVNFVTNFTDIDDKIIKAANEEGVDFLAVSEKYMADALAQSDGLNVKRATAYPRVTEEIDGIIEMIEALIAKGFAYETGGSVFFETSRFSAYGKLSGKRQKELEAGARVEIDPNKRSPMDFVLWKPAKPGEPKWPSPWGEGRPGWHIECSVMAKKYLGDSIDIHAGGEDLVFPHHENEIAQSESANEKPFAKYWLHNGMICVGNKKMAKSEGNFIRVCDITKEFSPDVLRFFILAAHYRSPLNFSRELMAAAENSLMRVRNCYADLKHQASSASDFLNDDRVCEGLDKFRTMFEEAMNDDFNTANAITAIFELIKFININITADSPKQSAESAAALLAELCGVLGIKPEAEEGFADESAISALIEERQAARAARDFAKADEIRGRLSGMGIILKDTAEGVKWLRKA